MEVAVLPVLAVVLVVTLLVALVVERQLVTRAPQEAERRLTAWLGVPTAVAAVGRPRDWVRHRTVRVVNLRATGLPIPDADAVIESLEVELLDVRLQGTRKARRVTASGGSFRAVLAEHDVRSLVDLPPLVRRLDLRDGRVRLMTSAGISVDLDLTVEAGDLVLRPVGNPLDIFLPVRHRIRLDRLPAGATVERAVVRKGHVIITGPIDGSLLGSDE